MPGVNASSDAAFVTVSPPLPCAAPSGDAGFVHALASDRLLVEFARQPSSLSLRDVQVPTGSGRTFTFRQLGLHLATQAASDHAYEARAESPDDLERLANLLTLIRKSQHISICETADVESKDRYTGLSDVLLLPRALPELSFSELDTRVAFLDRVFSRPFLITGMTGGLERGAEINRRLAKAAATFGIPMGVGSQRLALDHPEHAAIFAVKSHAPSVFLIGNLGIGQLKGSEPTELAKRAVGMIDADALALHINVLQEVIQVEGDRVFKDVFRRIEALCKALPVPVIVKEVGCGIDRVTAMRLKNAGVRAIDVGGKGGTSWNYIEGLRARSKVTQRVASSFRDFGIPTGIAINLVRAALPDSELVATGGMRDGLDAAKALGLGATMVGIGLPLLRAALEGDSEPLAVLEAFDRGLRTAMMGTGAPTLAALTTRVAPRDKFREFVRLYAEDQM